MKRRSLRTHAEIKAATLKRDTELYVIHRESPSRYHYTYLAERFKLGRDEVRRIIGRMRKLYPQSPLARDLESKV